LLDGREKEGLGSWIDDLTDFQSLLLVASMDIDLVKVIAPHVMHNNSRGGEMLEIIKKRSTIDLELAARSTIAKTPIIFCIPRGINKRISHNGSTYNCMQNLVAFCSLNGIVLKTADDHRCEDIFDSSKTLTVNVHGREVSSDVLTKVQDAMVNGHWICLTELSINGVPPKDIIEICCNNPIGCFKQKDFGKLKKRIKAESFVMQLSSDINADADADSNADAEVGGDKRDRTESEGSVKGAMFDYDTPVTRGRRTASFHSMSNAASHFGREKRKATSKLTSLLANNKSIDSEIGSCNPLIMSGGERHSSVMSIVEIEGNLSTARNNDDAEVFKKAMQRRRNSSSWTSRERRRSSSGTSFLNTLAAGESEGAGDDGNSAAPVNPITRMSATDRRGNTAESLSAAPEANGESSRRFTTTFHNRKTTRISGEMGPSMSARNSTKAIKNLIVDRNFRLWVISSIEQPNISDTVHKIDSDSIEREEFTVKSHVVWSERVPSDAEGGGETQMGLMTAIEGMKRRRVFRPKHVPYFYFDLNLEEIELDNEENESNVDIQYSTVGDAVNPQRRKDTMKPVKIDDDVELSWKYLSRAYESVEKLCDHRVVQARDYDTRQECLPLAMLLVRDYAAPILRKIELKKSGFMFAEGSLISDKIQFCKEIDSKSGKAKASDYQKNLIVDWKRTIELIGELVFSDGAVSNDGNFDEFNNSSRSTGNTAIIQSVRDRTSSMNDVKKHQKIGDIVEHEVLSDAESIKVAHVAEAVKCFVKGFV